MHSFENLPELALNRRLLTAVGLSLILQNAVLITAAVFISNRLAVSPAHVLVDVTSQIKCVSSDIADIKTELADLRPWRAKVSAALNLTQPTEKADVTLAR